MFAAQYSQVSPGLIPDLFRHGAETNVEFWAEMFAVFSARLGSERCVAPLASLEVRAPGKRLVRRWRRRVAFQTRSRARGASGLRPLGARPLIDRRTRW